MKKAIGKKLFYLLFSALTVILLLFSVSCKKEKEEEGMVLRLNNKAEPHTLDPAIATGDVEHFLLYSLYEGLVSYEPENATPIPGVAESWEVSDDNREFTFHLRKNAVWNDGTPITAKDFEYSWFRTLDPATASEYVYLHFVIKGAKAYYESEGKGNKDDVGVKAVDDYTFKVTCTGPTPYFLSMITHYSFYPVPKQAIDKYGNDTWYKPENIVTNGPFDLAEWVPQQHIIMKKSETYWDKDVVKLDKIIAYPMEDNNTAVEMFMNKEIHWSREFADERIDELKSMPETKTTPQLATYFYRINMEHEILKDKRIRKALSLSINRDDICNYVTKGGQVPAYSLTPPMAGYVPPETEKMNIEKAKQLLAEAGYPNGEGLPELTLLYNTNDNHKRIAEAIQQMWKENLGIKITLVNEEWKVYLDRMHNIDFEVCRAGWIGDYLDPNTFLDQLLSYSGNNQTHFNSPEYDSLIEGAAMEGDPVKRFGLFYEAEKIIMEELPYVPLFYYVNRNLVYDNVKNWYPNILDTHPPKTIYIEN